MRNRQVLRQGWLIRQVEASTADVAALSQAALHPDGAWMPAEMPAQVHDVLFARGDIPDPRVSKNAAACTWVGEKDWAYATAFNSPEHTGPVFLRMDGLDTVAAVYLNGDCIGRYKDMNRRHAAEVSQRLKPAGGKNVLLIIFSSPMAYARAEEELHGKVAGIDQRQYIRKSMSDFSNYLGAHPYFPKVGVFADIFLDIPDRAWIDDAWVRPRLAEDLGSAEVEVQVEARGQPWAISWSVSDPDGVPVAEGALEPSARDFRFTVPRPRLWWPRAHGEAALYTLALSLSSGGDLRDRRSIPFGLRRVTLILHDEASGEHRFAFEVNGTRIFLMGACMVPLEGMTHVWPEERCAPLLDLAEHANMNVLRVWADGEIHADSFYDACDRRGLLVWQDFMFGYGMHPTWLPGHMDAYREEAEETVRRLRNHPCIFLWCGGNENMMAWDFAFRTQAERGRDLFEQVLPQVVARLDPDRIYHPSSPALGRVPNWPLEGDMHDYSFSMFSPQASVPLFVSEIGRSSTPSLASMRRFLSPEELWPKGFDAAVRVPGQPGWPPMWEYRNTAITWDEVAAVEEFCDADSAEELIRVLGTAHGEYLQRRIERYRRGTPDGAAPGGRLCGGVMIWRLNDSWPIIYFAVVDYYLETKIAYDFLRRAYAPLLVCFERTQDAIAAWVVNDTPEPVEGQLLLRHLRFDGTVMGELSAEVALTPGEARRCLDATPLGVISLRKEFLQARFKDQAATCILTGERYLHLPKAALKVSVRGDRITVATDVFARQVCLEVPGAAGLRLEDNHFDLPPGLERSVKVSGAKGGDSLHAKAVNAAEVRVSF